MRRWWRALLIGWTLTLLAATPSRDYRRAHRDHTRKLVLYREFGTALMLRATLLTPPFRNRLAEERRVLLDPSAENHAEFVTRMSTDGTATHEVVFAADSGEAAADRFGAGDDRWNLRLEADGRPQPLLAVDRIRDPSMLHRALYPQLNKWSDLWIARFERTVARPEVVVLHIGSGYGNGQLEWKNLAETRR